MSKPRPTVSFSLAVETKENFDTRRLLGVNVSSDVVPDARDPVEYLRERVLAELDRVTLAEPGARAKPATVVLPGFEPADADEEAA